jgi:serine/threonine protein kinase
MYEDLESDEEVQARAHGRVGALLRDKYRLESVLGVGGMATVYGATHRNGKKVALKLLHPELARHADILRRFLREGYVANQVNHPGAVSVIDDDVTDEGGAFLVMELLEGVTVQDLWDARLRVNPACVVAIIIPLLDVMTAAHDGGIVHRDLKPANVFVTDDGEVKVLDFGIARLNTPGPRMTTSHGAVLGTPAFMAPEQALAKADAIDQQTDIWAVGATAFALIAGDVVHPADNNQQTLVRAATQPARLLADVAPDAASEVVEVFQRALAFNKADRWSSAAAMREALAQAAVIAYGQVPSASLLRDAVRECRGLPPSGSADTVNRGDVLSLPPVSSKPMSGETLSPGEEPAEKPALRRAMNTSAPVIHLALQERSPRLPDGRRRRALTVAGAAAVALVGAAVLSLGLTFSRPLGASTNAAAAIGAWPSVADVPASRGLDALTFTPAVPVHGDASPRPPARPPLAASSPAPRVPAAAAAIAPVDSISCTPPYFLEPGSGRKRWKVACL